MRTGWRLVSDLGLGILRARGADAGSFLQGQLSNDTTLAQGCWQLTGYHTPQGRTIALLRLTQREPGDLLALLPRDLVGPVIARLQRYVLRAKVQLADDSPQWLIQGYAQAPGALAAGALCLPYGRARHLAVIPHSGPAPDAGADGTRADWLACDIAEGLPQVYAATSEAFVAQMLNLDVTGGIALDKGCYTGQEIIARAHYRGQVKRRMQRFVCESPGTLTPGQAGRFADGRSFKVVQACVRPDGHCEFLAVANPPGSGGAAGQAEAAEAAGGAEVPPLLLARELDLPYPLPAIRASEIS